MSGSTAQLPIVLETTLALLGQFQIALSSATATTTTGVQTQDQDQGQVQDALPLITSSATALRAQATKLSLLAITSPFTQSAITSVLKALNESVLPSLVTASLLITPSHYTRAFHTEIQVLSQIALKELVPLVEEVKRIAQTQNQTTQDKAKNKQTESTQLSQAEKNVITTLTGRVWDACDSLVDVARNGIVGFVVKRVEQWRDLVRDAIEEIEEWDPEEEEDEEGDEFLDEISISRGNGRKNGGAGAGGQEEDGEEDEEDEDESAAAVLEHKKATVRFLKPIAQIYPAIVSNRLKKAGNAILSSTDNNISKLDTLMMSLQKIPDQVDEAAGALYEENIPSSIQRLSKVKEHATEAVRLVMLPWVESASAKEKDQSQSPPGDKFTIWSRTWLKVMEEVSSSMMSEMETPA